MSNQDRFIAHKVTAVTPHCETCARRNPYLLGQCEAFPEGIPMPILLGENDHTKPFEGDHGLQYKETK
jgi:hypothetical protein